MLDCRSKMASDIKKFMKESKILELKEYMKVLEALPYMSNLTAQTHQKIERKFESNGECAACHLLYEEVTRNPRKLFPELLAALKKTKQHDVYARFKSTLHECRSQRKYKSLDEILRLVKEEEMKKDCDSDSSDNDFELLVPGNNAQAHDSGNRAASHKTDAGCPVVIGDSGQSVVLRRNLRTPPLARRPVSNNLIEVFPSRRDGQNEQTLETAVQTDGVLSQQNERKEKQTSHMATQTEKKLQKRDSQMLADERSRTFLLLSLVVIVFAVLVYVLVSLAQRGPNIVIVVNR